MTLQELECAEKNMQQQWHDLVMAEQRGEALDVLEQMYDTYILLAEEYNRCSAEYQRECQVESDPIPVTQNKAGKSKPSKDGEHTKLAS